MNRCELFSKLTKSEDETCSLFEELLLNFFKEYTALYGAFDHSRVVDEINEISCQVNSSHADKYLELDVSTTFSEGVELTDDMVSKLTEFIEESLNCKSKVENSRVGSDTILTTIVVKKG